jgi:5-methylcytosine-specific restriction enzyme A
MNIKVFIMPSSPLQYCKTPYCPIKVISGYCEKHKIKSTNDINRMSSTKRGYDRHWQAIREEQLNKYPYCAICKNKGIIKPANEVHHIKPLSNGGTHSTDNLLSLCKSCHSKITNTQHNNKNNNTA